MIEILLLSLLQILSSIYCINQTTVEDENIKKLIEYALYRVYKESSTQMKEYCKDKEKSDVMPDLKMLLASETTYINIKKLHFKKWPFFLIWKIRPFLFFAQIFEFVFVDFLKFCKNSKGRLKQPPYFYVFVKKLSYYFALGARILACAAASLAIGTLNGEQLT